MYEPMGFLRPQGRGCRRLLHCDAPYYSTPRVEVPQGGGQQEAYIYLKDSLVTGY